MAINSDTENALGIAEIVLSEDDFSYKATCRGDGFFWVRVEKPLDDPVLVTDFNPGSQSIEELCRALGEILNSTGPKMFPSKLLFVDVLSGQVEERTNLELEKKLVLIQAVMKGLFNYDGQVAWTLERKNQKLDVLVDVPTK